MAAPSGNIAQIHAIDPNGKPRAIECDDDDILLVSQTASGVWVVKQTDPDLLKSLIHGDDSSGDPQPLQVDANKSLLVAQKSGDEWEVIQDTPADLLMGSHAYDGSNWRKNNMLWGYHDTLLELASDTSVAGGTCDVQISTVPTGEIWVVNRYTFVCISGSCTGLYNHVYDGAIFQEHKVQIPPTSSTRYEYDGVFCMKEGQYLRLRGTGMTAGDHLYLTVFGYKMDIAM